MKHCTLLWLLLLAAPVLAQQPQLRLDLPSLAARADQVTDVTLDGAALRMGAAFLAQDEGDLSQEDRNLLTRLKGIYVKSFEFDHAAAVTDADLAPIREQLHAGGWSRIVSVHAAHRGGKNSDTDEVYLLSDASGAIQGVAIIAFGDRELNLVNIVGPIQLSELSALGGHLGIPEVQVQPPPPPKGGR